MISGVTSQNEEHSDLGVFSQVDAERVVVRRDVRFRRRRGRNDQ